jgi:pimeloyl-ACP methyl ester carboxylesterase
MLTVISCRESSTSANQFGAHVIHGIPRLFDGGPSAQPILIHGYNRTEDQVLRDYNSFSDALGRDCIAYSWPGGCHPLDFPSAVSRARLAGYRLRDVLSMRYVRACVDNLVTHSLGARVALTALAAGHLTVKNLILMAPAVDWDAFESGGEFESVPHCCESVHVLYSNRDEVLKLAFPLGDFGGDCHALGLDGPRDPLSVPPSVRLHDLSAFIPDHSAYVTDPQCAALVKVLLEQ